MIESNTKVNKNFVALEKISQAPDEDDNDELFGKSCELKGTITNPDNVQYESENDCYAGSPSEQSSQNNMSPNM